MRGSRTADVLIVLAALCAALLAVAANLVAGEELRAWLKTQRWYSLEGLGLFLLALVVFGIAIALWQQRRAGREGRGRPALTKAQLKRNRQRMIQRVRCDWIQGVLEQSLYRVARIDLNLEDRPDAVDRPWDLLLQVPDQAPRVLPPGTRMSEVFEEHGGALLILGAPGSGKTTLLLELARDLLDRAERDESYPIPVVFHLSSWAAGRPALPEWLADELRRRYDVPEAMARSWTTEDQILPLLDGLDEVPLEHREACVAGINEFRKEHGLLPIAVCSRTADYEVLGERLRVSGAVVIQPLTRGQVEEYFKHAGPRLDGLRAAVENDEELWALLDNPLMLSVAMLAHQGGPEKTTEPAGTLEDRRTRLFAKYVETMFQRRGRQTLYTREQSTRWLAWLASSMVRLGQSVFHLEDLAPRWLWTLWQRRLYVAGFGLVSGLISGMLGRVIGRLDFGLLAWLYTGSGNALSSHWFATPTIEVLVGCLVGIICLLLAFAAVRGHAQLHPAETLHLSWKDVRSSLRHPVIVILLLVLGLSSARQPLRNVLALAGLLGLVLAAGLVTGELAARPQPNDGTRRSLRTAGFSYICCTAAGALMCGCFIGVSPSIPALDTTVLILGLTLGATGALALGGDFCLQHFVMRLLLWRSGCAPWDYVPFLDYAAHCLFLRKVGGGYIFVHRLLQEHFAAKPHA